MTEEIRAALQKLLDASGDGWTVTQFVVSMGLERITPDGNLQSTAWYWAPPEQPDWQTAGLLEQATEMHYAMEDADEEPDS